MKRFVSLDAFAVFLLALAIFFFCAGAGEYLSREYEEQVFNKVKQEMKSTHGRD